MNDPEQTATVEEHPTVKSRRAYLFVTVGCILLGVLLIVLLGSLLLRGGTTPGTRMVYEVDEPATAAELVEPLRRRLDGLWKVRSDVQVLDGRRIEVLIATQDQQTIDYAKKLLDRFGVLRFLILANPDDHPYLIELATSQSESTSSEPSSREVMDENGSVVGRWVTIPREIPLRGTARPLRVDVADAVVRHPDTRETISIPPEVAAPGAEAELSRWLDEEKLESVEVLVSVDPRLEAGGSDLSFASVGYDRDGSPSVRFSLNEQGSARFYALTLANAPEGKRKRRLGIILDDLLLSAPNIISPIKGDGTISGNFSQAEVEFISSVLRAGSLPARVREVPGSEAPAEVPYRIADFFR